MKIFRVSAVFLLMLLGTGRIAAAQDAPKYRAAPRPPAPIVVPQELSPPQETYAAFPEEPATTAAAPEGPSACQLRLGKLAVFQPLPVLVGPRECGATDAVLLQTIILPDQTKVPLSPAATLRCPMAEQVAQWIRDDVAPSVKKLGPPISGLDNYDSYECRGRNRVRGAKLSEHGRANALDVRGVKLADGRLLGLTDIKVDKDWRDGMRASACARFSTILGPGSDGEHEEHIHLDLAERRNNYKICEWDVRVPAVQAKAAPQPAPADNAAASADDATAEGEDAAPLPLDTVPLPRQRPRAADATPGKTAYPLRNTDQN